MKINTIPQLFRTVQAENSNAVAQLAKDSTGKFQPSTYSQLYKEVSCFAAGLLEEGVKRHDNVGLISDNRKEWLIADLACLSIGAADVPRGRDSMPHEIQYILKFSSCQISFAENKDMLDKILSIYDELPDLKTIIILDPAFKKEDIPKLPRKLKVKLFQDLIDSGMKSLEATPSLVENEIDKGEADDTATIIFTSGTTGEPKGVMLSHKAYLHQVRNVKEVADFQKGDVWLSVLPVWHSFERIIQYVILGYVNTIAYSKPIGKIMMQDFQKVRPVWMGSVPRIWEGVRSGIQRNVDAKGPVSKILFRFFVAVGSAYATGKNMFRGLMPRFTWRSRFLDKVLGLLIMAFLMPLKLLGDKLIFSAIKLKLGGRFKAGVSGGGSLPAAVDTFFQAAGITLLNGYGLTETGPIIAVRNYFKPVPLTLDVLPDTEIRILDEQGNNVPPNTKGVIWAKGEQLMKGYYNRPDLSEQIMNKDGWVNTGDIGVWTLDGQFDIRGRAKDTIVLFGGENIEPAPLENKLRESIFIEQAMIVGQDQKFLGALIVIDQKEVELYLKNNNIPYVARATMRDMPEVQELINAEIQEFINPKTGFKSFERVFRFALIEKSFEIGVELSAKQEIKRHIVAEKYKKEIAQIF